MGTRPMRSMARPVQVRSIPAYQQSKSVHATVTKGWRRRKREGDGEEETAREEEEIKEEDEEEQECCLVVLSKALGGKRHHGSKTPKAPGTRMSQARCSPI